jgi:tetratricopeptide (TPR) repeat protein
MSDAADTHKQAVLQDVERAVALTREGRYSDALEIFEQLLPQLSSQDVSEKRILSNASSFYGLCVAMVRRRYAEAVQYCNLSLKSQFMEPDHLANLALVYLERNDRADAIENLQAGLRIQPNHARINKILDEIGRRQPPVISFLSRNNPLNIWLGKRRRSKSD